jgi:predicted XRE-type DNA-binding protein
MQTTFNFIDQTDIYPQSPGWKRRDTSEQAAEDIKPSAETLRNQVYQLLKLRTMSADECAELMEVDKLSIRPRFSELAKMNKIEDTGKRTLNRSGKKAIVWRLKCESAEPSN